MLAREQGVRTWFPTRRPGHHWKPRVSDRLRSRIYVVKAERAAQNDCNVTDELTGQALPESGSLPSARRFAECRTQ
jgi:hypothetical protein